MTFSTASMMTGTLGGVATSPLATPSGIRSIGGADPPATTQAPGRVRGGGPGVLAGFDAPPAGAVVHGRPTAIRAAPWAGQVLADDVFLCGGALVAPRIVLTAAHCAADPGAAPATGEPPHLEVVFGRTRSDGHDGQEIDVVDTVVHPGFRWGGSSAPQRRGAARARASAAQRARPPGAALRRHLHPSRDAADRPGLGSDRRPRVHR